VNIWSKLVSKELLGELVSVKDGQSLVRCGRDCQHDGNDQWSL